MENYTLNQGEDLLLEMEEDMNDELEKDDEIVDMDDETEGDESDIEEAPDQDEDYSDADSRLDTLDDGGIKRIHST